MIIICPECKSYKHCKVMGWANAVECKNFEKSLWQTKEAVEDRLKKEAEQNV